MIPLNTWRTGVEAQREVMRRSWPPRSRWPKKAQGVSVAKLDRLSRSIAFIATLMDRKGFDLAVADMPGG
jgi:hypothetical protein